MIHQLFACHCGQCRAFIAIVNPKMSCKSSIQALLCCNSGHGLVSIGVARAWLGLLHIDISIHPFSAVVDCGTLTDPLNGEVIFTTTTFMSTATYSCNSGYILSGSTTRTCEASGTWSDTAPTCDDRKYSVFQISKAINCAIVVM